MTTLPLPPRQCSNSQQPSNLTTSPPHHLTTQQHTFQIAITTTYSPQPTPTAHQRRSSFRATTASRSFRPSPSLSDSLLKPRQRLAVLISPTHHATSSPRKHSRRPQLRQIHITMRSSSPVSRSASPEPADTMQIFVKNVAGDSMAPQTPILATTC
jgi:hypothetical protein